MSCLNRRGFIKKTLSASALAAVGKYSFEEKALSGKTAENTDNNKTQTIDTKQMPMGNIGSVKISRIITGGNLIAGVAHARDLIYANPLLKNYFTDEKIMETWRLSEENGINTMSAWPTQRFLRIYKQYRKNGGKIQWLGHISCSTMSAKVSIDNGAVAIYIAGDPGDTYVREERFDELSEVMEYIKSNGLPAGIAGHPVAVPKLCEENGVPADFYMKTIHSGDYWSATPPEKRKYDIRTGDPTFEVKRHTSIYYHDNIWCLQPEETIEYMKTLKKPWIGFKILAAGAINPRRGFQYAFESGADFIHVGMFDFQIKEDALITKRILSRKMNRERAWMG